VGQVVDEVGGLLNIADREGPKARARLAFGTRAQNFIVVRANDTEGLFLTLLKVRRDGSLGGLGALFEVFRVLSFPVVQVVNAVNQRFVALLQTHHQRGGRRDFAQFEHRGDAEEVFTFALRVYPKVG